MTRRAPRIPPARGGDCALGCARAAPRIPTADTVHRAAPALSGRPATRGADADFRDLGETELLSASLRCSRTSASRSPRACARCVSCRCPGASAREYGQEITLFLILLLISLASEGGSTR